MMKIIFMLLVVTNVVLFIMNTPKRRHIRYLGSLLKDFMINYTLLQDLMDKEYDMNQIKNYFKIEDERLEVIKLSFGNLKHTYFTNTKEMRQCFLFTGEYIIKLQEILEEKYSVIIDSEKNNSYNIFLEMLKDVRRKSLMLNENTNVVIK